MDVFPKDFPSDIQATITALRRELHKSPELSWQEEQTSQTIARELTNLGLTPQRNSVPNCVYADIPGELERPYIVLRADLDALPIVEKTGLAFSSKKSGVMHACGHDAHMSMLIGAAALLVRGERLRYPVRLLFQPAEERGEGAKEILSSGLLDDAAMIFGGHVDRHYPAGTIVLNDGPMCASTDQFFISIEGASGHGARPHETVDAIIVGGLILVSLQTIVSREVDPAFPSVISVGTFQAGTAPNVIAGQATLSGTIRAQHNEVRDQLVAAVERIARSVGNLHGANIELEFKQGTPALCNSTEMAAVARSAATGVVGPDRVVPLRVANMGGEDFAYYLQKIPGAFVRYGSQLAGHEGFPAHSERFDINEDCLPVGAGYLASVALEASKQLESEE